MTEMISLLDGLHTTRSIRRYTDEPVTDAQLATICFAATRAPSGSNRQPFRFLILRDSASAKAAKALIGGAAQAFWAEKRAADGYDKGSGASSDSPKARMARSMQSYVDGFTEVPALILPCIVRHRSAHEFEGASVYPACQNLLLAARAIGLGGVLTGFHQFVAAELAAQFDLPDNVGIAATITMGHPAGNHGPVRRRPMAELIFEDSWERAAPWAVDPPGTEFTSAGPPRTPKPA